MCAVFFELVEGHFSSYDRELVLHCLCLAPMSMLMIMNTAFMRD